MQTEQDLSFGGVQPKVDNEVLNLSRKSDAKVEFTDNLIRYCQRVRAHSKRAEMAVVAAEYEAQLVRCLEQLEVSLDRLPQIVPISLLGAEARRIA